MAEDKKKGWFRGALDKIEAQVETQKAQHAASEAQAGKLAIQKSFGTNTIAIYDGGFVRVSKVLNTMTQLTPYEKLRSISYREHAQERGALESAWNGGFASKQKRNLSLTIATDRTVRTLTTERQMLSSDDKAGMALEAAGQAVLDSLRSSTTDAAPAPAPDVADQLKKLAELHAAGVLTDEEFAAKKADLLNRM